MLKDKPHNIETDWDEVFEKYIKFMRGPEEIIAFESQPALIERIIRLGNPKEDDTVLDMGVGLGKLTLAIAPLVRKVIAVDSSQKNIEVAREEGRKQGLPNIKFVMGSFLEPNVKERVNLIVSSLAFHHVVDEEKGEAIKMMYDLLEDDGRVVLCDDMFFFDPERDPERFNQVYRYLVPKIVPKPIWTQIEQYFTGQYSDHVYTWDDMKKYTPKNEWFYKASDMIRLFEGAGFTIEKAEELAPFFGILCAKKVRDVRR